MSDIHELSREYLDLLSESEADLDEAEDGGEDFLLDDDDQARLKVLQALNLELNGALDYPSNLGEWIPEGEFKDYVREMVISMGQVERNGWADDHVDWAGVAEEWESDYETVEFDGGTYYWKDSHG